MEQVMEDLNLSYLLEHEREMILKVLQKDEKLRKREEKRIRKLKNELLEIRRKGSRRPQESGDRQCARCTKTLGLIFDRGELCEECELRVCSDCRVTTPKRRQWKCNVCAKISELKVVTGEWFLEERSKRFEQKVPSSDVVKQTIISSPPTLDKKSTENLSVSSEPERLDAPKPNKSAIHNVVDGIRKKGRMKMDKKGSRSTLKPENGVDNISAKSDGEAQSVKSVRSGQSPRSNRGDAVALESSGMPTVPNNLRSQTLDRSSTPSDNRRVRPDGAESVASLHSSDSEKKAATQQRKNSGTPTISVSRASISSDHSRSEMDLSAPGSEPSDDAFSLRSRSVPGLNETEFSDEDAEEDIDALMSAHSQTASRRLSVAVSTSSINSMMSMYSETGDYGNARVSGEILLNISYSYKTGALNVLVKECHNLATGDERRQRTDAYVKTYLLPDTSRQSKRKTSIKANTINPVFSENLRYVISHSQLETRTLQVSVWHHDRFGHNSFLGEVELTFDSWEFDSQIEEWYALQPKLESSIDSTMQYKGELTVVLKYIPAEKNLTLPLDQVQVKKGFLKSKKTSSFTLPKGGMVELLVKGAKNLTAVKSGGTSDSFVKGYLLPDSNKSTKHKTAVERRTVNPQWNHTFTYCGLQPGDLNNVCLELTVWDKEALASNVFLGGVRLGAGTGKSYGNEVDWMDSYGEEQRLWQRMIENPEVPHECTLMLRSSMRKCNT
ncbi:synaptotagmin-like protein 5 isoform X1 [Scomber japonicus]|uniref:synaptotagmin-like protein 5 isoform X1 n=1 Tax=Scomber japonicus TaxID=13676 RepID=UPI002304E5F3|nr:synaptotagmin-like protein 5 isoform X1 [Scomber japonicus]XP_053185199.1 synaptotagmin-like protein 5 isoform X1 [Scomber japonicus]